MHCHKFDVHYSRLLRVRACQTNRYLCTGPSSPYASLMDCVTHCHKPMHSPDILCHALSRARPCSTRACCGCVLRVSPCVRRVFKPNPAPYNVSQARRALLPWVSDKKNNILRITARARITAHVHAGLRCTLGPTSRIGSIEIRMLGVRSQLPCMILGR